MFYSFNQYVNVKNLEVTLEHLDNNPAKLSQISLISDGPRGTTASYKGMSLLVFYSSYGSQKTSDLTYKGENSYRVTFEEPKARDVEPVEIVEMTLLSLLKFIIENKPNAIDISPVRTKMAIYFGAVSSVTKNALAQDQWTREDMKIYNQDPSGNYPQDDVIKKLQKQAIFNKRFDAGIKKIVSEASKATGKRYKISGSDLIVTPEGYAATKAGGYNTDGVSITSKNLEPRSDYYKTTNKQIVGDIYRNRRNTNKDNANEFDSL